MRPRDCGDSPPGDTDTALPKRKRVAAYCRYSDRRQDKGYSIAAQHDAILLRAQREDNWDITWWDEPARSAFNEDPNARLVWNAMMDAVRAGEVDVVVVYDVSRFSRRGHSGLTAINAILKVGAQFISLNDGAADSTSPVGVKTIGYAAVDAEAFAILLGIRASSGMEQRVKRGLHVARPPFGYAIQNVRDANKLPFVPDVPDRGEDDPDGHLGNWAGLKTLLSYLLMGMTNQEAADAINAQGVWTLSSPARGGQVNRPFTAHLVGDIRHNVFYRPYGPNDDRGTVIINGMEYRGLHIPACTWDEWQTMQEVAKSRRRGRQLSGQMRGVPFEAEFRGVLCCAECGSRLYVSRLDHASHTEGEERLVERYWCSAKQVGVTCASAGRYIYATEMRQRWIEWLTLHPLPPDFEERVRQHVLWMAKHERQGKDAPDITRVMREKDLWETRRANAMTAFLDGKLEEREWRRRIKEADAAIKKLNHASRNAEQVTIRLLDAARIMTDAASAWEAMNTQERQMAAQLMIAERGVRVECLGARGRYHRSQKRQDKLPSGRIIEVRLREPFRDLLSVVTGELVSEGAAG